MSVRLHSIPPQHQLLRHAPPSGPAWNLPRPVSGRIASFAPGPDFSCRPRVLVAAAFSLACAGAALAAPLEPVEGISIFAEYSDLWVEGGGLVVGAGYGLSESLAFGAFLNPDWSDTVGLYGCFAFDRFRVNLEITTDFAGFDGLISGRYVFDLDPLALGVGAGATVGSGGGSSDFFAQATAEYKLDAISIYGGVDYIPGWSDESQFFVGASYTF